MPTLNPVRKRISEEGFEGILHVSFTLRETGAEFQLQIAKGTYSWTGSVTENLEIIHDCAGGMEDVLTDLEQYLTREELIPTEVEFLTDRELLEAMHRKISELDGMLRKVQENQGLLRRHQIEYIYRHPEVLEPQTAFQRVSGNPLGENSV